MGLALAMQDTSDFSHRGEGRNYRPKPSPKPPIPRGCKEYTIDGITVVAISEKHARHKVARKKGGDQ